MALHVCVRPHATHYVSSRYPSKKKEIGVSDLLVWAYRDEMVHAARPEGVPAECAPGSGGVLRFKTLNDVYDLGASVWSSRSSGFEASPDAYRIHAAVLALAPIEAQLPASAAGGAHGNELARGTTPEIERAFVVKRSSLVMTCALDGHPPDWIEKPSLIVERGALLYQRDRKGRIMRDKKGNSLELVRLVSFVGDAPWAVAKARRIYEVWIETLRELRESLAGTLERFDLSAALPAARPWARMRLDL
jgi:hypothetical protein